MIFTRMPFGIDDFVTRYPKYKGLTSDKDFVGIFDFLRGADSIDKMITATKMSKAALAGVVQELEAPPFDQYLEKLKINFPKRFDFVKQAIGSVAYFILEKFGYGNPKQKTMSGSQFFTSASHFEPVTSSPEYKLETRPTIYKQE